MGPAKVKSESRGEDGPRNASSNPSGSVSDSGDSHPHSKNPSQKGAGKGKTKPLSGSVATQNPESIELQRRKLQSQLDKVKAMSKPNSEIRREVDLRKSTAPKKPQKKPATMRANLTNFSGSNTQKKLGIRERVHRTLKHPFQLMCRTVKLREALEKRYYDPKRSVRSQIIERRRRALGLALDGVHKLEFSLSKKVNQFKKEAKRDKLQLRNFKSNMSKGKLLDGILRDLEQDKIFENKVAYMYLCAILDPERFKNIGIPDAYNAQRSGKPTIVTEYIVPFDSEGEAAIIVSDDPLQHITVIKGGTASETQRGPTWTNVALQNGNSTQWTTVVPNYATSATADPYAVSGNSCTFKVNTGQSGKNAMWFRGSTDEPITIMETTIDGKKYEYLPLAENDTFIITFSTPDSTANGFTVELKTILEGNVVGSQGPTNVTGSGVTAGLGYIVFTLAATTLGVYSYTIKNTLAGTDVTPNAFVKASATKALGQIVLPCGKANGDDVNFLIDYCDEYRSGPCSVLSTYYGGYLENGLILQGQLPKDDDFILPPPNVQNWGLIPGVRTKALNDPEDPGAYTAMIRKDYSSTMWDNLSDESDENTAGHEQVIIFIKANGTGAEFVRIRTALQFQYRTEVQSVYTDEGMVDEEAMDLVANWIAQKYNGYSPTFGNCDHEQKCDQSLRDFEKDRGGTTISFFNGWFSGNDTKLSNEGEIIA